MKVFVNMVLTLLIVIGACFALRLYDGIMPVDDTIVFFILFISIVFNIVHSIGLIKENTKQKSIKHSTFKMMDNLPIGVIAYDQQGSLMFINEACQKMLQISHTDVVGRTEKEIDKQFKVQALNNIVRFVLGTGKSIYGQRVSINLKTGTQLEGRMEAYPFSYSEQHNGVLCILTDITTELNYNNLKRISDTIFRDMESAVVAVNSDQQITIFNQMSERITGAFASDVIGKTLKEAFPENYLDFPVYKAILAKEQISEEYCININGNEVYTFCKADVLLDEVGTVSGAICVAQDITDIKREHKMMLNREKLAVIGQMAAGMAHELRNPLTAVRGFAQLLNEKASANEREIFNIIITELDRTEKIVRDFLQLSRPKEPEFKQLNINQLLEKLAILTESECLHNNIKLTKALATKLPPVLADADQISQVMLNLIHNAIEALNDGQKCCQQKEIVLRTSCCLECQELCIEVADNGIGIPLDHLAKLGTPFFSTKSQGTGLGLAITYTIIKRHGGRVDVDSKANEGTRFKIYLPLSA